MQRCLPFVALLLILPFLVIYLSCVGLTGQAQPSDPNQPVPIPQETSSGVLMWKGDPTGAGLYANEVNLTPGNVNPDHFGRLGSFQTDGLLIAQPLYVAKLDMGTAGTHNLIIAATEHESVYAIDADNPNGASLWERHYVDPAHGILPLPDSFGGRSSFDGEVGITGTPFIDSQTGAMYFVTTLLHNGVAEQWLRSIDIRTGKDYGAGSMLIQASVPGDGKGNVNGQIPFDPSNHNQRAGLTEVNGTLLVAWGSFSDWGVYHGWLMAFDPKTLKLIAAFNPTTQYQPDDPAHGPSDHGGGGSFWQGGAAPAVDSAGYIYLNTADGSFNADQGGNNYGDTMLKLRLNGNTVEIVDWFTPSNQACVDTADLELGSGGVVLLPTDITGGSKLAASFNKEGRLYLVNTDTMGKYNPGGDQVAQEFMIGEKSCVDGMGGGQAEGPDWNRLYGNPSYWNGNLYAGPSNSPLKQYQFQNGKLNPTPVAWSPTASGFRGFNTVVSANGNKDGILWAYEKALNTNQGVLHAYDATNVSRELWNSNMNAGRDSLGAGIAFGTPVIVNGRVIVAADHMVSVYGEL